MALTGKKITLKDKSGNPIKDSSGKHVEMPVVSIGTWRLWHRWETEDIVRQAIDEGYRAVDTAAIYHNEEYVGTAINDAIAASGGTLHREDFFISSKLDPDTVRDGTSVSSAVTDTLTKLNTPYVDIMYIHMPGSGYDPTSKNDNESIMIELEKEKAAGRIRAIGVSNMTKDEVKALVDAGHRPDVIQVNVSVGHVDNDLLAYCASEGIQVVPYSPLASSRLSENETIKKIADAHGVSWSDVALAYAYQKCGCYVVGGSKHDHIKSNIDPKLTSLTATEMAELDAITIDHRVWSYEHSWVRNFDRSITYPKPDFVYDKHKIKELDKSKSIDFVALQSDPDFIQHQKDIATGVTPPHAISNPDYAAYVAESERILAACHSNPIDFVRHISAEGNELLSTRFDRFVPNPAPGHMAEEYLIDYVISDVIQTAINNPLVFDADLANVISSLGRDREIKENIAEWRKDPRYADNPMLRVIESSLTLDRTKLPVLYTPTPDQINNVLTNSKQLSFIKTYVAANQAYYAQYLMQYNKSPSDAEMINFFYGEQYNLDGSERFVEDAHGHLVPASERIEATYTYIKNTAITNITSNPREREYVTGYALHYATDYNKYRTDAGLPDTPETAARFYYESRYDENGEEREDFFDKEQEFVATLPKKVTATPVVIAGVVSDPDSIAFVDEYCVQNISDWNAYKISHGITTDNPVDKAKFFYHDVYNPDGTKKSSSSTKLNNVHLAATAAGKTVKEPAELHAVPSKPGVKMPTKPDKAPELKTATIPLEKDDGKKYINGRKHVSSPKWLLGLSLILSFIPFLHILGLIGLGAFVALETDFFQNILPPKVNPTSTGLDHYAIKDKLNEVKFDQERSRSISREHDRLAHAENKVNALDKLIAARDAATDPAEIDRLNARIALQFGHHAMRTIPGPYGPIPVTLPTGDASFGATVTRADFDAEMAKDHHDASTKYTPPYDMFFDPVRDSNIEIDTNIDDEIRRKKAKSKAGFSKFFGHSR